MPAVHPIEPRFRFLGAYSPSSSGCAASLAPSRTSYAHSFSSLVTAESLWNETCRRSAARPSGEAARPVLVRHFYLH